MIEWYEKAHALLSREPLTHAMLERAVDASPIALRPGFAELASPRTPHRTARAFHG